MLGDSGGPVHPGDDTDADVVASLDDDDFWRSRQVLDDVRQFARSRQIGPYALLGNVLARVTCAIPPHVVLPPARGSWASLNQAFALVGGSGGNKSVSIAAADDFVRTDPVIVPSKPGSGEGLAKCFAYVTKQGGTYVQHGKAWTVLAVIPEVEGLHANQSRAGSNIMAELRSGWSGERLGWDYADANKRVLILNHRYRLVYVLGVQPMAAQPLFDGADVGTPQRILWLPVTDPKAPRLVPDSPSAPCLKLEAWPDLAPPAGVAINREARRLESLELPTDPAELAVLDLPPTAREQIQTEAYAALRRPLTEDSGDGHRLLKQAKLAASLMALDRRYNQITESDWELADHLSSVSDRIRTATEAVIRDRSKQKATTAAVAQGITADVADNAKARQAISRVSDNLVRYLRRHWLESGVATMSRNDLRKTLPSRDKRDYFDPAIEQLRANRRIDTYPTTNSGPKGLLIELLDLGDEQ